MKRWIGISLVLLFIVSLCACRQKSAAESSAPTWQEQYDLGFRYLSEGNYEEAIIAFTAAIEINPKQPDAYIGLADVYIAQDDTAAAKKTLEDGLSACGENEGIQAKLQELDTYDTEAQAEYAKYFTANLIRPQELTINGVPFWEASVSDAEAVYPDGEIIPASEDNPYEQYTAFMYGTTGMRYDCLYAGYDDGGVLHSLSYHSFLSKGNEGFSTEVRDLQCGQTLSDVVTNLGLTDAATAEIAQVSNTGILIDADGQVVAFDCNDYDTSSSWRRIDIDFLDFIQDGYQVHIGLTFEDELLSDISFHINEV
jgi:hypothetical protein